VAQNLQDRQIGFERVSLTLWNGSFSNQLLADLATNQLAVLSALGADTLLWHPAEGVDRALRDMKHSNIEGTPVLVIAAGES
jgi:hypothetical protein